MGFLNSGQMSAAVFLVTKSMIGPTILVQGYVMRECGVIFGSMLVVFSGALAVLSGDLLLQAAAITGEDGYSSVVTKLLGPLGGLYVNCAIVGMFGSVALGVGSCTALHRVCMDVTVRDFGIDENTSLFVTSIVACGLSLFQDLRSLDFVNSLSVALYTLFVAVLFQCVITTLSFEEEIDILFNVVPPVNLSGFSHGFAIVATAFNMHQNIFLIRGIFGNSPNASDLMRTALFRGAVICGLLYAAVGIAGLLLGGLETDANILRFMPSGVLLVDFTKLAFCVCMITTAPLSIIPAREALCDMLPSTRELLPGLDIPLLRRRYRIGLVSVIVLVAMSTMISIVVPGLDVIFGLIGSICGVPLSLLLPSLLYLRSAANFQENAGKTTSALIVALLAMYMCASTLGSIVFTVVYT